LGAEFHSNLGRLVLGYLCYGSGWADRRLCVQANGEDFRSEVTDEWATEVLRQTPGVVRLTVLRDETLAILSDDKDLYEVFTLDLVKKPGKGLGFSIVGRQHDNGIYVSDVVSPTLSSPAQQPVRSFLFVLGTSYLL